ncbi:MAG TPA: alpha/beta hydrolase [Thermoanaerobaculia bacterium]|nr:alpha/beta hydrolase [Thermoanaerobaculia bacterium]
MRFARYLLALWCLPASAAVTTSREVVTLPGVGQLQAVVSTPSAEGPKPALLVVGWLSCDSVNADDPNDGFIEFLNGVVRDAGLVVMRVDKPGVGGSDGNCAETDFRTELEGYRAAWKQLAARADVDRSRMFVLGLSNGGGVAPLVPGEPAAAGFVSVGGWSRTWFEHMMSFERRRMTLKRLKPDQVSERMKAVARLYDAYLNEGRTPEAILRESPDLAIAWEGNPKSQYGRPPSFFQQLQQLNLASEWARVTVPTLVVYGDHDWIMDREEQELIVNAVNLNRPQLATLTVIPRMDHFFSAA